MKYRIIISFLLICTLAACTKPITEACIQDKCFDVDLAQTQEEQEKGLMYITELAQDKGMLFVYETEEQRSFWMKNTKIPLDIIWITDNKITHIATAEPCEKDPCPIYTGTGQYILEVNPNQGFQIGDEVIFK